MKSCARKGGGMDCQEGGGASPKRSARVTDPQAQVVRTADSRNISFASETLDALHSSAFFRYTMTNSLGADRQGVRSVVPFFFAVPAKFTLGPRILSRGSVRFLDISFG